MCAAKLSALVGLVAIGVVAPALGQEALQLGRNPGECEISAALGIAKTGCASLAQSRPAPKAVAVAPVAVSEPVPVVAPPPPPPRPFTAAFQIGFEFASARLTPESQLLLERIGRILAGPEAVRVRFRIVGHTDGVGPAGVNLELSRQRASAVRDFLVKHAGMNADRFEVDGRGATELLNKIKPAAPENRRVEITNLGE